ISRAFVIIYETVKFWVNSNKIPPINFFFLWYDNKVYGYRIVKKEEKIMKTNQKLFTSGEFAFLCGVKKQTLFHYDDIGLLTPEYKNNKGYRYYSVQQAEIFSVIQMLKEIGMSLTEIKE